MDPQEIIQMLWKFGHFRNPYYRDGFNVKESDLANLKLSDPVVKRAIRSYQKMDANFEYLVQLHHERTAAMDGEVGPATEDLFSLPRCDCPDFAMVDTPDEALAATGSGSWPVGCVPGHESEHAIRVNLDTTRTPSKVKNYLDECMRNVEKISASIGLRIVHVLNGDPQRAEQDIRWQPLRGNIIGWNGLPTPNTCRQTLQGRLDTGYQPDAVQFSLLMIHEYGGHGVNLPHSRGGIMNPSLLRVPISWDNDPSYPRLKRYFGGEPLDPTPGPDPPIPPDPDGPTGTGRGELAFGDKKFLLVALPK